jgi:recombination protein RecA
MSNWAAKLTKSFGKIAEEMPKPTDEIVTLPSPSLNYVVGNGGITRGKVACLFGPESGGKSLLMQLIFIQLQKDNPDGLCILFDTEYSFNPVWFKKLGGDTDRLIVRQSNDPLKIFDYIEGEMLEMLQDGAPIVGIGIDSVKNIRYPKDMKDKSTKVVMGGGGASYLGSALKGVIPVIRDHNLTTVFVQQVYEEMDEYKKMSNPYIVPDGRALKHACDYMLEVTRVDTKKGRIEEGKNIYGGDQQIGHKVRVKNKKNRVGAPFRVGEFSLSYTKGIINQHEEIFDLSTSLGVVDRPNNMTYEFNGKSFKGKDNFKEAIKNDPKLAADLEAACMSANDEATEARNESIGLSVEDDVSSLEI